MNKTFVICDHDVIDSMAPLLHEFLEKIVGINSDECLVTDESSLADFSPPPEWGGLPEGEVLDKVELEFGVRPARITDTLVVILGAIAAHRAQGQP